MKTERLNLNQRKFLSDFLNGLSIALFSAGVISPLFIKTDSLLKLIVQILSSVTASAILFLVGLKNLRYR